MGGIKFKLFRSIQYSFFAVLFSFSVVGQEYVLTLSISDLDTKDPLSSVTVLLDPCSCGGITNPSGIFSKRLKADTYTLSIEYLGYRKEIRTVVLDKNTNLSITMETEEEQLSEIIVLAQKRNQNVESTQMGVFELNARDLIKIPTALGEFDVLRSITLLAGVNNTGDISNGVSIRGGSLDQNLMLYESAPVFNPTHLFGLFSVFTPDVISGVNIYQANIPAKYGGRIASVVDIKVKSPYTDKFKLEGGVGVISSRLSLSTPIIKDKLMLLAGGRIGFTDFLFPLLIPRLKNTKANFKDSTVKLLYLPNENNQLTYTHFFSQDFYQLDLISSIENIVSSSNQYDFGTSNHTLRWLHSFDNETNLVGTFVHSNYLPQNLFPEIESTNVIRFESQIQYTSAQFEYKDDRNEDLNYYAGLQLNQYGINPGSLNPGSGNSIIPVDLEDEKSRELSFYANLNWNPSERLSISSGLRFTNFSLLGPFRQGQYTENGVFEGVKDFLKNETVVNYSRPEPRIGINYKLGEDSALKASYARIYQYIQNIYNTSTPLPTSRWKMSDTFIQPQKNDTYGLGLYKNFPNLGLEISSEGYYRITENNLTYKPGADFFLSEFLEQEVTQAEGNSYGVEMSLRKNKGKVNGFINYTWSRSLLKTNELALKNRINNNNWYPSDFDRPHTVNATVNFEGDAYNAFSFNFTGQTGRPYTVANGVYNQENVTIPIFLSRNNGRLPVYHRLDFSWKIAYRKDPNKRFQGDWTLTVYNLYGRRNPFNVYYTQRNGAQDGDVFGGSPLGAYELSVLRGSLVSIAYNFKFL
ncbi:MAG: TonB-dependent receptor [Flavobacteriaceae bacterium]|nr:TonB-dependent receptor [Flavobacteriaceae bacterium]|tara:strand:- start:5664 stop:8087 length:2424 start_codon:yes stop_codon:yes gene_type:complete